MSISPVDSGLGDEWTLVESHRRRRWPWIVGVVIVTALLAAQGAFIAHLSERIESQGRIIQAQGETIESTRASVASAAVEIDNLRIDIDRADANFNTLKASLTKYAESVNASIAGLYDAVSQASNQTLYCTGSSFGSYSYTESFTCT